jgi:hypothetical protein
MLAADLDHRSTRVPSAAPLSSPQNHIQARSSPIRFGLVLGFRVNGRRVKTPRHFILYRQCTDAVLEVLRILHDSAILCAACRKSSSDPAESIARSGIPVRFT